MNRIQQALRGLGAIRRGMGDASTCAGTPPQYSNLCWALRNGMVDADQFDPQELMQLQLACSQLGYAGNCPPPPGVQVWKQAQRAAGTLPRIRVGDLSSIPPAPPLTGVSCGQSWAMGGASSDAINWQPCPAPAPVAAQPIAPQAIQPTAPPTLPAPSPASRPAAFVPPPQNSPDSDMCPFYLNPFTRELWGEYDAYVIPQMEAALADDCYRPKIYKSPDITQEVLAASGPGTYVSHGLKITPGSLILGYLFPSNFQQVEVNVQITDTALEHRWFSEPIPWYLLSNGKPFMPNFLRRPYPIVEPGLFLIEFWNVSGAQFRTQLRFLTLEPKL